MSNNADRAVPASRVAAFFDLDKTIIARSSAYAFNKQLLERGIINATTMMQLALSHTLYLSQGHDESQLNASREQLSALVAGHSEQELRQVATESLATTITPYIYSESLELIKSHREQGHEVFIISASARQLVDPIAQALGIPDVEHHVIATELQVRNGVFTGELEFFCKGENKAAQVRRLAKKYGFDLEHSYAYSDSITDQPMLSAVGHPVAINPDRALRRLATSKGWQIRQLANPVPLFRAPSKRDVAITAAAGAVALGVGAGVAGLLALRKPDENS